jgi:hypothetical protein
MAGTIICDYIRADANKISLNVGNTVVASINASGILSNTGSVIISPTGALGSGIVLNKASLPTGSVLQVVNAYTATGTSITTTTYTDSTVTASITPNYSSSKILVLVSHNFYISRNSISANYGDALFKLVRSSTDLASNRYAVNFGGTSWADFFGHNTFNYLDSPSTTSSTTYKVQFRSGDANYNTQMPFQGHGTITLLEIAA